MQERFYVDINAELVLYESIISKYVYSSIDWGLLYFVPFRRYPLTSQELRVMGKHIITSHTPFLPFIGILDLVEWVKNEINLDQALSCNLTKYYKTNHIAKQLNNDAICKSFINNKRDILDYYNEDLVSYLLEDENNDLDKLYSICDTILDKFLNITSKYSNRIFDIESNGPMIELINLDDICLYRYKETEKYVKRRRI